MIEDKIFFELSNEDSVISNLEVPPSMRKLGGSPDIATDTIRLFIGTKPVAFNLKKLYQKIGKQIPPEIEIFKSYNAYILNHNVGAIKEGGGQKIVQIGYRVKFPNDSKIVVLDVMPQSKFVTNIEGKFNFEADLNLNGELSIPSQLTKLLEENIEYVGLGGKLKASTDNNIVGRFSFSVQTPVIQSIGKGNNYSEWVFEKDDKPLHGDDFEMYQIILVDRFEESIEFEANIYAVINTWNLITSRRESNWVKVRCELG